ncbi:MAG: GNAT family protein [Chloroflexota bacterium]
MFNHQIDRDLIARLPEENDVKELLTLFKENREYLTYWNDWPKRIQTVDHCSDYINKHRQLFAKEKSIPALMVHKGKIAGLSALDIQERCVVKKGELSYWIGESFQGNGIVTKTCQQLIAYAFNHLGLNRIVIRFKHIDADHENEGSRRVAERLGFIQEGVQRQGGVARGQFMDMIVYSLLREEWQRF